MTYPRILFMTYPRILLMVLTSKITEIDPRPTAYQASSLYHPHNRGMEMGLFEMYTYSDNYMMLIKHFIWDIIINRPLYCSNNNNNN